MDRTGSKTLLILGLVILWVAGTAGAVACPPAGPQTAHADAAVVLGAAAWGHEPSPVFRERINHAIHLYRRGQVDKLVFTGGRGHAGEPPEAIVAATYARAHDVPEADILVEIDSHTTRENLHNAQQVAAAHGLTRLFIVSDPLHMRRALILAHDLGIDAYPAPTPTSMYRSPATRLRLLARETYMLLVYRLRHDCAFPPLIPSGQFVIRHSSGIQAR